MSAAAEAINPLQVKAAWSSMPLRNLCEFHNGLWKGKKGPFETATVIRNTNFTSDGRIDLSDVAVLEVEARQFAKRRLQKNDIIIEKSGGGPKQPVGRVVMFDLDVEEKYSFSNFTSVIRVVNPSEIDPAFLHHVLYWWYISGRTEAIQSHSTGIRNLDFNAYKDLVVPLPPLAEQKRIVAILDQAFAALDRARALAEANLADAENLFDATKQSILDEMSGEHSQVSLAAVATIESLLIDPRDPRYIDLPHIGAGNISSGSGEIADVMTAREEKLISAKYLFDDRDVLYSKIRPYLRKVARPDFAGMCSADMYPLRPSHALDRGFLFHTLLSTKFTAYAEAGSARAGMPKVNREHLFKYEFQLPPIAEQRKAVAKIDTALDSSSELRQVFQQKLTDLADLRQSLLQKAFSGQLT